MDTHDTAELARVRDLANRGQARRIRIRSGLSLVKVAAPCGVTPACIHRWEVGDRRLRGEAAIKYLKLLDEVNDTKAPA